MSEVFLASFLESGKDTFGTLTHHTVGGIPRDLLCPKRDPVKITAQNNTYFTLQERRHFSLAECKKRILCTVGLSSSKFLLCPFTFSFHEWSWLNILKKTLWVWCHHNEQSIVIGASQYVIKTCSMEALSIVMQQFLLWKLCDATFLLILCETRCHFLPFLSTFFLCEGTRGWCEGQRRKRLIKEPF